MALIQTYYLGATNFRSARIVAKAMKRNGPRVTLEWDYALDVSANHTAVAQALAVKCGWAGDWRYVGDGPDGEEFYSNQYRSPVFTVADPFKPTF